MDDAAARLLMQLAFTAAGYPLTDEYLAAVNPAFYVRQDGKVSAQAVNGRIRNSMAGTPAAGWEKQFI